MGDWDIHLQPHGRSEHLKTPPGGRPTLPIEDLHRVAGLNTPYIAEIMGLGSLDLDLATGQKIGWKITPHILTLQRKILEFSSPCRTALPVFASYAPLDTDFRQWHR